MDDVYNTLVLPAKEGFINFFMSSPMVALAGAVTILGAVIGTIRRLVNFTKSTQVLVKEGDKEIFKEKIKYFVEYCVEIFYFPIIILLYIALAEFEFYIADFIVNIHNRWMYNILLLLLLGIFICFSWITMKSTKMKKYLFMLLEIILFDGMVSFVLVGIILNIEWINELYLFLFAMIITYIYIHILLYRYECKKGIFLCKGNSVTFALCIFRNVLVIFSWNFIMLFQNVESMHEILKFLITLSWVGCLVIAYVNFYWKIATLGDTNGVKKIINTTFGCLISTHSITKEKQGIIAVLTCKGEKYFLDKEKIVNIRYNEHKKRKESGFSQKSKYMLKLLNETNEEEYDTMKYIGKDWIEFSKFVGENRNVMLIPRDRMEYFRREIIKRK